MLFLWQNVVTGWACPGTEISREKCLGCGICASRCPEKAITLQLAEPTRDDVKEYYAEIGLDL